MHTAAMKHRALIALAVVALFSAGSAHAEAPAKDGAAKVKGPPPASAPAPKPLRPLQQRASEPVQVADRQALKSVPSVPPAEPLPARQARQEIPAQPLPPVSRVPYVAPSAPAAQGATSTR